VDAALPTVDCVRNQIPDHPIPLTDGFGVLSHVYHASHEFFELACAALTVPF
jgi:hypothetical protein